MQDERLLKMWFDFLSMFQGMNVNIREMESHIEFEPNTYYAAFSAELEASASPMWALVHHLKVEDCFKASDWLSKIRVTSVNLKSIYIIIHHTGQVDP